MVLIIAAVGCWVFLSLTQSYQFYYDTTKDFAAAGSILHGEGLFVDRNGLTEDAVSIDWGNVSVPSYQGEAINVTNTMKNPVELYFQVTNWNPPNATDYLKYTWDYDNKTLAPNERRSVVFFLEVCANTTDSGITNFNSNIMITAVETGVTV